MSDRDFLPSQNYQRGLKALLERRFSDALGIFSGEPPESDSYCLALGNQALVHILLQQFDAAEELCRRAAGVIQQRGCPYPASQVQFAKHLGEAALGRGRFDESLTLFWEAHALGDRLRLRHPDHARDIQLQQAQVLSSIGAALLERQRNPDALEVLRKAVDIFRRLDHRDYGYPESLTHLAHALRRDGQLRAAELALQEAMECASKLGAMDQVWRILQGLVELGSQIVPADRLHEMFLQSALSAEQENRFPSAYLRLAIGAQALSARGDSVGCLELVLKARSIEQRLQQRDLTVPQLRFIEAWEVRHRDKQRAIEVMMDAARHWMGIVSQPLVAEDVRTTAGRLHDHFRLLCRLLLEEGRVAEALVAFEVGRSLAYALLIEPAYLERIAMTGAFANRDAINVQVLTDCTDGLNDGEVLLTLAIVPEELVGFIVSKSDVVCERISLSASDEWVMQFVRDMRVLPKRLEHGVGFAAIPAVLAAFAEKVRDRVGARRVRAILPHGLLHLVPWRALFRSLGASWEQFAGPVEFSLLLRGLASPGGPDQPLSLAIGLGHGSAGTGETVVDLTEEARRFTAPFGNALIRPGTSRNIQWALGQPAVVLVSCHGDAIRGENGVQLWLQLADGSHLCDALVPDPTAAPLVILSACDSGVYEVDQGDFPTGAAPLILRRGAKACIGARYGVRAVFALEFTSAFAEELLSGHAVHQAFVSTVRRMESAGVDLWRDLACFELLTRP